jgi:hypothetical protein
MHVTVHNKRVMPTALLQILSHAWIPLSAHCHPVKEKSIAAVILSKAKDH